jgi:hypothetical protein
MPARPPLDVVSSPEQFLARRLRYRDAVAPALVAIGVGVLLSYAYRPFVVEALLGSLPGDAAPDVVDSLVRRVLRFSAIGAAVMPLAQIGLTAALAFVFLTAHGERLPRFESLCVCVSWAALLLTGRDAARFGMLLARGLDSVRGLADLQPGVGLGFLASAPNTLAYDLLEAINGFDVGYVLALAVAVSRSEAVSFRTGLAASGTSWLLLRAVRIGAGVLFHQPL